MAKCPSPMFPNGPPEPAPQSIQVQGKNSRFGHPRRPDLPSSYSELVSNWVIKCDVTLPSPLDGFDSPRFESFHLPFDVLGSAHLITKRGKEFGCWLRCCEKVCYFREKKMTQFQRVFFFFFFSVVYPPIQQNKDINCSGVNSKVFQVDGVANDCKDAFTQAICVFWGTKKEDWKKEVSWLLSRLLKDHEQFTEKGELPPLVLIDSISWQ